MKDGIIKADGTSRLARSVADFKTQYPTYDDFAAALVAGTLPLDILFNEAGWSQVPDFLNQANLLKETTATRYGKGGNAVPDDVLVVLSRFQNGLGNEYVWAKTTDDITYVIKEKAETQAGVFDYGGSITFYASASLSDNNEIVLSDAVQVLDGYRISDWQIAVGTYYQSSGVVYHITRTGDSFDDSGACPLYGNPLFVEQIGGGVVGYVNSPYFDEYPPAEDDGYTYTALGQLGAKGVIETGSYVGDNAASKSLTFSFEPKVLLLQCKGSQESEAYREITAVLIRGSSGFISYKGNNINALFASIDWDGNTVTWSGEGGTYIFNSNGVTCRYAAFR